MIKAHPHPEDPEVVVLIATAPAELMRFGLRSRRDRFVYRCAITRERLKTAVACGLVVQWPPRKRRPMLGAMLAS